MKIKSIFLICMCLCTVGCRIRIEVPSNGSVGSESTRYACVQNQVCDIDVSDIFFDETFEPLPHTSYVFTGWKKRDRGLCGGNANNCRIVTKGFDSFPALIALLENPDEIFYLEPVFRHKDDLDAKIIELTGDWKYVETQYRVGNSAAACVARGVQRWKVERGVGRYVALKPGSERIVDVDTCEIAIGQPPGNFGLLVPTNSDAEVSAREIASWNPYVYEVIIHGPNRYTRKFKDGTMRGSETHTRIQ